MDELIYTLKKQGITTEPVLKALQETPREYFVPNDQYKHAYDNTPLPIGHQQTISQPYIVARMTELLLQHCTRYESVLEIGTGSGYQTAILSHLFDTVYSIERIETLHTQAKERLATQNLTNIHLYFGDGYQAWPHSRCFDGIIVTAAPTYVPPALMQQCHQEGAMVIPLTKEDQTQYLFVVKWDKNEVHYERHDAVRFVPMRPHTD